MIRRSARALTFLLITTDVAITAAVWVAVYGLRFHSRLLPAPKGVPDLPSYLTIVPFMALLWPLIIWGSGGYRRKRGRSTMVEAFALAKAVVAASVFLFSADAFVRFYGVGHVSEPFQFSRLVIALFIPADLLALCVARIVVRHFVQKAYRKGYSKRKVLIAGAGDHGSRLCDRFLDHDEFGYEVVGFVDDEKFKVPYKYRNVPVVGCLDDIMPLVAKHGIHEVFIALPMEAYGRALASIATASRECVDVRIVPDLLQYSVLRASVDDFDGLPVINLNESPHLGLPYIAKRLFDLGVSLAVLTLCSPLMLIIAAAVKLHSKGPVLFTQERMGLDGRPFIMYKFRTMGVDAERHTGPVWAKKDDPRRTRLGAWLRKYSLDELPQFVNVLKGEMSVVGPRPERPAFVQEFKKTLPQYMLRHKVKAGITGWAQVNGWRCNTSI